jgi:hypothetical protein
MTFLKTPDLFEWVGGLGLAFLARLERWATVDLIFVILTCRLFRDLATEFLYTNVCIRGYTKLHRIIFTLEGRKDLNIWVTSLVLELDRSDGAFRSPETVFPSTNSRHNDYKLPIS